MESATNENLGAGEPVASDNVAVEQNHENPIVPVASDYVAVEQNHENPIVHSEMSDNGGMDSQPHFSEEEVRDALETSASTGKFWQEWETLKNILSYYLKQVASEYPEAKLTAEQQISSLGETFQDLVKRLDDALHSFDEGPPFTLQRLCEILLSARSIYPKLSKLSLALEKNLLVTSTLTISKEPYPLVTKQNSNGSHEVSGDAQQLTANSVENGVEPTIEDRDEVMAEAEETGVGDDTPTDMETTEDIVRSSEANSTTVDS